VEINDSHCKWCGVYKWSVNPFTNPNPVLSQLLLLLLLLCFMCHGEHISAVAHSFERPTRDPVSTVFCSQINMATKKLQRCSSRGDARTRRFTGTRRTQNWPPRGYANLPAWEFIWLPTPLVKSVRAFESFDSFLTIYQASPC
jgi:hypothetical protein